MKVVASVAPPGLIEWRRHRDVDRHDEMWEGVLHMNPLPNRDHQVLVAELWLWLHVHWAQPRGNRVYLERNVAMSGAWPNDYRGPDLVLLTPDRFQLDKNQYIEGPPTVVVEIRSPDDESYEKLPFYTKLGVPEVWIIDHNSKQPEVFVLGSQSGTYEKQSILASGWLASQVTDIELTVTGDAKLAIRICGEPASSHELPES